MAQPYAPLIQQMLLEFQNQRLESTERIAQSILRINPKDLIALQVYGLVLAMQGRLKEAVEYLSKAALQDSKNPELLSNLAKAQYGAGLYIEASQTYEKLNRLAPNNPQVLTDMGTVHGKLRQYERAASCYDKAIELAPNYFLAWSNRGNLFLEQGFPEKALVCYETALKHNPDYPETWTNYGNAYFDLGRFEEAKLAHERALSINPAYGEAWSNHGNTMLELKKGSEALASYQKAYDILPEHPFLIGNLLNAYRVDCDWGKSEALIPKALEAVAQGKASVPPFILLQTPAELDLQKIASEVYVRERIPVVQSESLPRNVNDGTRKIRIGYFSTDFKEHPVGILMENLIGLHDRSRFEVLGFFLNKKSGDDLENRLTKAFDNTIDLYGMSDAIAQQQVLDQHLDIAIDLNGHTAGARTGLFACHIAPIQVNFLGYAGTSGVNFYDYIIVDKVVVPPENQKHFVEKLAYLPNSFFPADTLISHDAFGALPSRESQGLPSTGFVFACFNNSYKISPDIFSVWMKLLLSVPQSVLWLTKPSDSAILNLRRSAQDHGVDPDCIVFASRVPARVDHLSRLRLADLFLDTLYFNAHTTAADALWAGVPVLTCPGNTFASRVAASQLSALGLTECITKSLEDYYAKALELATQPNALRELRDRQEGYRLTSPLFNSKQYVLDLENLYLDMMKQ